MYSCRFESSYELLRSSLLRIRAARCSSFSGLNCQRRLLALRMLRCRMPSKSICEVSMAAKSMV